MALARPLETPGPEQRSPESGEKRRPGLLSTIVGEWRVVRSISCERESVECQLANREDVSENSPGLGNYLITILSPFVNVMETPTLPSRFLTLTPPFPFTQQREDQDKLIFGDKKNFQEIKQEIPERKSGFRFEHLATEFENRMEENDSGIGKLSSQFVKLTQLEPFLVNDMS